ncbi:MAG: hypothetical protein ACC657_16825 [Thiohalomonadales bacterium]
MKYKIKRFFTSVLPVAENRIGGCIACGDCCRLPKPCTFLRYNKDNTSYCAIYQLRPMSCRKYPRTSSEFITPHNCGFEFKELAENT